MEPYYSDFAKNMADNVEGFPSGSVGWSFLMIGFVAIGYQLKSKLLGFVPALVLLISYIKFGSEKHLWLLELPWHSYARVATRFSFALPAFILAMAVGIPFLQRTYGWRDWSKWQKALLAVFIVLVAVELPFFKKHIYTQVADVPLPDGFIDYMEDLRQKPGEAVLDWPFCYTGGNGGGHCVMHRTASIWAMRKYHDKKVLGTYFGRLRSQDFMYYHSYGLHKLLEKQSGSCLSSEERSYIKYFLGFYDFAGLQLYSAAMPKQCLSGWLETLGPPERKVAFPSSLGEVWFFDVPKRLSAGAVTVEDNAFDHLKFLHVVASLEILPRKLMVPLEFKDIYEFLYTQVLTPEQQNLQLEYYRDVQSLSPAEDALVVARHAPKYQDYTTILSSETLWYGLLKTSQKPYQVVVDLWQQSADITVAQSLELRYTQNTIWTHPIPEKNLIMQLSTPLALGEHSQLVFGIGLGHSSGHVSFEIYHHGEQLFQYQLSEKLRIENLSLKLPVGTKLEDLEFVVDPLGPNSFDMAYWWQPQIRVEQPQM